MRMADAAKDGGTPTFREAMERVIETRAPSWRNPKSGAQWRASLEAHAAPLMDIPVSDIEPDHVREALLPIWVEKSP